MRVVGLDRGFDIGQRQAAVPLVFDRLRLHAAENGGATALPSVAVRHLADDIFLTPLAMAQDRAQIALGSSGHKKRGLKAQ